MIDELDRCRPSYAVELLEVAKHLFSVDHIVFVLAINRSQLSHSISGVYGADFDATDYLRRFFDIDFRLPEPDKKQFVDAALTTIGIEGYFGRTRDIPARGHAEMLREMLRVFFGASDLSLRRIAQATHRLGLVFGSLRSDELAFTGAAAVALILRTIDVDLYHRFTRGDVSDLEVIENVYDRLDARSIRSENEGELFEALVILAFKELTSSRKTRWPDANSPLLQSYQELVEQTQPDEGDNELERRRAQRIVERVQGIGRRFFDNGGAGIGFRHSVKRIELLSSSLIGEHLEGSAA